MVFLLAALALLGLFVANVAFGAVEGEPVLGVVAEMLLLLAASICFVVAILRREAREAARSAPRPDADRGPDA